MNLLNRNSTRFLAARLLAASALWLTAGGLVHADVNASTDDKSVDVPTGWYTYANQTVAQISSAITNNGARITTIEPYDAAAGTFTVTMVRNSGAYAVPGWFWYVGQTAAQISSLLSSNSARLINIAPYSTPSGIRFAAVMVSNSGAAARAWTWLVGVSSAQVDAHVSSTGHRLIELASYVEDGATKYVVITVANTGADAKAWEYWYNQSAANVGVRVNTFGGRLVSLKRRTNGGYDMVQVKNAGGDSHDWRYYFGLSSLSYANQVALQFGSRVFDVDTYISGGRRLYNALIIDNADSEGRRMRAAFGDGLVKPNGLPNGQWGAYVKPLGSGAVQDLNGERAFEPASAIKAVHNLAVMLRVRAGSDALASSFVYYTYPSDGSKGQTSNACPYPSDETTGNAHSNYLLDKGKDEMMRISDNRTTRGITLRYGLAAIQDVAFTNAQMFDTFIEQPRIGCGYTDNHRNQTTLADLGKLYERVENGALLGIGADRDEFFSPMGSSFDDSPSCSASSPGSCYTNDVTDVVREEAAALNKAPSVAADFISRMKWRHKGGSYSLSCTGANSGVPAGGAALCSKGHIEILTEAGRLILPSKNSKGKYKENAYVFGNYSADINACDANAAPSDQNSCAACPDCVSVLERDTVQRNERKEQFRSIIHQQLATY